MDDQPFSSDIVLIADDGELRITGPQQICFPLREYLQFKGLATGALEIIKQRTVALHSTAKFEAAGKTGDEVKELIESFLSARNLRFRTLTIPHPPHGFEIVFRLVDVSLFRPH